MVTDSIHSQALAELSWIQKSNGEYPTPVPPEMRPKLTRDILKFDLSAIQPKQGIACLKKWVENPEFTPEKAGEHSLAARALVEWIRSADAYFKERKSRPTGEQIEVFSRLLRDLYFFYHIEARFFLCPVYGGPRRGVFWSVCVLLTCAPTGHAF